MGFKDLALEFELVACSSSPSLPDNETEWAKGTVLTVTKLPVSYHSRTSAPGRSGTLPSVLRIK